MSGHKPCQCCHNLSAPSGKLANLIVDKRNSGGRVMLLVCASHGNVAEETTRTITEFSKHEPLSLTKGEGAAPVKEKSSISRCNNIFQHFPVHPEGKLFFCRKGIFVEYCANPHHHYHRYLITINFWNQRKIMKALGRAAMETMQELRMLSSVTLNS